MSRAVWKYPLQFPPMAGDVYVVPMPAGARVLTAQMQAGLLAIWALVDPTAEPEPRRFRVAGTGHPIEQEIAAYIGTFQLADGALVFHVFEVQP